MRSASPLCTHTWHERRLTSTSSFGRPSSASWHHRASDGSIAASRTRGSGARPTAAFGSSHSPAAALKMLRSIPLNRISVARSRHTSSTRSNDPLAMCVRVSASSASNVVSAARASCSGIPPWTRTCRSVSDVGGSSVDAKLWTVSACKMGGGKGDGYLIRRSLPSKVNSYSTLLRTSIRSRCRSLPEIFDFRDILSYC